MRAALPVTTLVLLTLTGRVWADTTITVDGDLSDWPAQGFQFLDAQGDTLPWRDITSLQVTDDNASGSDGNLYLGFIFRGNFRRSFLGIDIDVFVYLDIDGDGTIGGTADRVIEVTEGEVTDGDGNPVGSIGEMAFAGSYLEASIPYAVLGLSYGSDVFGLSTRTVGLPGLDDWGPEEGQGQNGFIGYDGTQEPEPLAVKLLAFTASAQAGGVRLEWATGSERGNVGFHIYRRDARGRAQRITEKPLAGLLDAAVGKGYRFHDPAGRAGDIYWLEDIELGGRRQRHGPQEAGAGPAKVAAPRRENKPAPGVMAGAQGQDNCSSLPAKLSARREWLYFLPRQFLPPGSAGLALDRRGGPVPLLEDEAGWFFLGQPERDRYADYEVLVAGPGRGRRMRERRVSDCPRPAGSLPAELLLEENRLYYVASPRPEPFYWASAFPGADAEVEFDAPGLVPAVAEIELEVCGTSPDGPHRMRLELNGAAAGEFACAGRDVCTLAFPAGGLLERGNRLRLAVLTEDDVVFLDRLRLRYQRRLRPEGGGLRFAAPAGACLEISGLESPRVVLLEATDPAAPTRLLPAALHRDEDGFRLVFRDGRPGAGQRVYQLFDPGAAERPGMLGAFRPAPFGSPALAAEYLVIHHQEFSVAAERMCALQRQRGHSCLAVPTDAVFDAFAFGRPGAQPIRSLLQTAFSRWAVAPRYVLLLGGATVDSNDFLGQGNGDFVPAAFIRTGRGWEAASDAWYVLENGRARAAIGRLAARSAAEAEAVVEKIGGRPQPLLGRLLFVADRDAAEPQVFERAIDALILALLPPELQAERIHVRESQDPAAELRAGVEEGVDAVLFFGHAFLSGWSSPPLVTSQSAAGFGNRHLFLALSMSCFDGAFTGPWAEALSWAWVKNPTGGAWGALAFSSLSDPGALRAVSEQLLGALVSGKEATLGEAWQAVRDRLSGNSLEIEDALDTLNLLGDPAAPNPFRR